MKIRLGTIRRIIREELSRTVNEENLDSMMNREAGFGDCSGSGGHDGGVPLEGEGMVPPPGLGDEEELEDEHEQKKEGPEAVAARVAGR